MEASLEWILTNTYKADLILWLAANPETFEEIIKLSISDKKPYSWRASWLLWSCMKDNDPRVQPYISDIISILPERNDDHVRELMIILRKMKIPEESEGLLFDQCTRVWEKVGKKPGLRLNAFKLLIKIAGKHPELLKELTFITQSQYIDSLSAASKKTIRVLLHKAGS